MLRDVTNNGLAANRNLHVLHGDSRPAMVPVAVERLDLGGEGAGEPCLMRARKRARFGHAQAIIRCGVPVQLQFRVTFSPVTATTEPLLRWATDYHGAMIKECR